MSSTYTPPVGVAETIAPGLRRITAPNPSAMTFRGTNTYLIGETDITVIDPGPDHPAHLHAILSSLTRDQQITCIIVTHAHRDHSALAQRLSEETGAPTHAFGKATSGRSGAMMELARSDYLGGGEGLDHEFSPQVLLRDGETIESVDHSLKVWHTPGHLGGHICLQWKDDCFTGDLVMGWATSVVSPPDGDLTDFMRSCNRLQNAPWQRFFPGHGDTIDAPLKRLKELIAHRRSREDAILDSLRTGALTSSEITQVVYHDTPPELLPAAERNVLAHLIDLIGKTRVSVHGRLGLDASFELLAK